MAKEVKKTKVIALSEAAILVIAILASAYMISGINLVSATDGPGDKPKVPDIKSVATLGSLFPNPLKEAFKAITPVKDIPAGPNIADSVETPSGWLGDALGSVFGTTVGNSMAAIVNGALVAAAIYAGGRLIMEGLLKMDPNLSNAISAGFGGAYLAGTISANTGLSGGLGSLLGISLGLATFGVGIIVGALIFALTFKSTSSQLVVFSCTPWQAPSGGTSCDKCNQQGILPCTEYQCRSLGAACELVNKGTSEQRCVWNNRNDAKPPVMQPWQEALLPGYRYTPDNTISPPDRGVNVVYSQSSDGCAPAFTPIKFGVTLDEPAKCRVDVLRKTSFDNMSILLDNGFYLQNHSVQYSLPSNASLAGENLTLQNGGRFSLYFRCEDKNGNSNLETFVFKYCVTKGPDPSAPEIMGTSILNNSPIQFGQKSIALDVYVNEPSQCKWSINDRDYNSMENNMSCATSVFEMNAQMLYKCKANLTGLKDEVNNDFYFRCKDVVGNIDKQSYAYRLVGTRPLVIDSVGPNGTIRDSTNIVTVKLTAETSAGYSDGQATCQYSDTGNEGSYVDFFNTGTYTHEQDLQLLAGNYTYYIKCFDLGGNADTKTTNFTVETDSRPPQIVRVYHQDSYLKIVTDEKATCVYSPDSCSYDFNKGLNMTDLNDIEHYTDWNTNLNFYIKCKDAYGNQPSPDQCSIVARPFVL